MSGAVDPVAGGKTTPVPTMWKRIGGGGHLNRPIRRLIETASFDTAGSETGRASEQNPMTFMYEGRARPA